MTTHRKHSPIPRTTVRILAFRFCLNNPLNAAIAARKAIQPANREIAICARKSSAAGLGREAKYTKPISETPAQL